MATEKKTQDTPKKAAAADKSADSASAAKTETSKAETSKAETSKTETGKTEKSDAAGSAPANYSRGEGQKAVTQAYRDNWDAIFRKGAKKKKK